MPLTQLSSMRLHFSSALGWMLAVLGPQSPQPVRPSARARRGSEEVLHPEQARYLSPSVSTSLLGGWFDVQRSFLPSQYSLSKGI
jgi:hypothetical protein